MNFGWKKHDSELTDEIRSLVNDNSSEGIPSAFNAPPPDTNLIQPSMDQPIPVQSNLNQMGGMTNSPQEKTLIQEEFPIIPPMQNPISQNQVPVNAQGNSQNNTNDLPGFEVGANKKNNDLLIPTPPPELMQKNKNNLNLDIDRLMDVEEEFLYHNERKVKKQEISKSTKPIFIKVENYEETLQKIIGIRTNSQELSEIQFKVGNLNDSQSSKLETLHGTLEDIQRKLIFIDNLIFERDEREIR